LAKKKKGGFLEEGPAKKGNNRPSTGDIIDGKLTSLDGGHKFWQQTKHRPDEIWKHIGILKGYVVSTSGKWADAGWGQKPPLLHQRASESVTCKEVKPHRRI